MCARRNSQVAALLFTACLCTALYSQSQNQTPTITATTDLVIVPALVRGTSGDLVHTLHASDFLLTDNGVPQTVTVEDTERQPLSIVVLMQTGASAPRQFPDYAKLGTMLTYLTGSWPSQVAMVTFDSQPEEIWDFTANIDELEDGFTRPEPGDRKAAILDAVRFGIDLLRKQPPTRRRLILLLSQTHDEGSVAHAEEIIQRLGENNITIECLTFSPEKAWLHDEFTGPRHENPLYQYSSNYPLLLHTFNLDKPLRVALSALREDTSSTVAILSGGESFHFATKSQLEAQLSLLTNHLSATATLIFRPTSKQAGFHSLQLHIANRPDLEVSARTSYWASGL